jgi:hypothetical protein
MRKDAQKTACHAQLKQIDGSKEMWATQEKRADGDTPSDSQLGDYFKDGMPTCPGGGSYSIAPVGTDASCVRPRKTGPINNAAILKRRPMRPPFSFQSTKSETQVLRLQKL